MEVGLVDVAALRYHLGGDVTRGEEVIRVIETDELGCRAGDSGADQPALRWRQ